MTLGELLTKARKRAGLTAAEASRRIGITPQHMCYLEKNTSEPSWRVIVQMAKLYKTTVSAMLKGLDQ